MMASSPAELVIHNARITTLDPARKECEAIACGGGRGLATGGDATILAMA